jgi:hypothetical protein
MVGQSATLVITVKSDERTRNKLNGFLCVDAQTGEEFLRLSSHAKTEDISLYLAQLCLDCVELGVSKLCIILDNNPTHKQKMRLDTKLHSYVAHSFSPPPRVPASPRLSQLLCLNATAYELATHLQQMGLAQEITVEFLYVPPYSPKLNLVE